uniref:Uncharacterized protein n=1 Tax=Rhizophora mucronata TaxID=61149 RepID=A0A2P2N9K9_RHIMU
MLISQVSLFLYWHNNPLFFLMASFLLFTNG